MFAGPVAGSQFVGCGAALVSSFEVLTCSRRIIVTVSLRPEVDDLLLAVGTSFDHLLLALRCRRTDTVARHIFLTGHSQLQLIRRPLVLRLAEELHIDLVGRQAG